MKHTNRLTKTLSKYFASNDDLRPAMQGIAFNGRDFSATNGHILVYGKTAKEFPPLFPCPGVYRIDEKQAMNAEFFNAPHEVIDEQYPNIGSVVPRPGMKGQEIEQTVGFTTETLYSFIKAMKDLGVNFIDLHIPEDRNRAVMFEAKEVLSSKVEIDSLKGLVMPRMLGEDSNPMENPFTDSDIQAMHKLRDAVNGADAQQQDKSKQVA